MRVVILSENSVHRSRKDLAERAWGLLAEHGWSVYIETEKGRYLFDTGFGSVLLHNAKILDVDLSSLDAIFLSHNHNDHTGGLEAALGAISRPIPVYAHPDLFAPSCSRYGERVVRSGMMKTQADYEKLGARFHFSDRPISPANGFWLTGYVPRKTEFEQVAESFFLETDKGHVPDPIASDQSLVIQTPEGLFVVLGCAHSGIINTLEYARQITGENRIHTVIGGTHLGPAGLHQREETMRALQAYDIQRLGVSHCTGQAASARLWQEFGPRFFVCSVGTQLTF